MGYASIAAGILGGIAGGQKDNIKTVGSESSVGSLGLRDFSDLSRGQSSLEQASYNNQLSNLLSLQGITNAGPGISAVNANNQYQNQFAGQLQGMLQRLNNPSQADIQNNYAKAQQIFAPQQTALNQQFIDQNTASNRLAARLGRPGNDPILRNKLMQEQTRQQTMLNSQIGSYGANELPQQQANNLINMGGYLSNLRQGLASQAFTNRQAMLQMGNQLTNAERQYRIQTANRLNSVSSDQQRSSGGGFGGALSGALGAIGDVAGPITSLFGSMGGSLGTVASGFGGLAGGAGDAIVTSGAIGGAGGASAGAGVGGYAAEGAMLA